MEKAGQLMAEQTVKEIVEDDCLSGVYDEKTTLQEEGPNLNSKWRKALLTLPARAKTRKRDGTTACFAMS